MANFEKLKSLNSRNSGQVLIELLVALTIGGIIIASVVSAIALILRSNKDNSNFQTAAFLNRELIDNVRSVAEAKWHDIYNLPDKSSSSVYFINASGSNLTVIQGKEGILNDDLRNGLIGHWKFDEATGTIVYDFSGNNQTAGMFSNASSVNLHTGVNCKLNSCGVFDGDIQRTKVATSTFFDIAAGNFSVCAWFRTADTSGHIVTYKDLINGGYDLRTISSQFRGSVWYSGNSNEIGTVAVANNLWHSGCLVVDTATKAVYVDGLLNVSSSLIGVKTGAGSGILYIGDHNESPGGSGFNGRIDKVRIYNRALSADEIRRLYDSAIFTRYFSVENVERDAGGLGAIGAGSNDPSTQKITAHTQWLVSGQTGEVLTDTYITRWRNFIFQQTDWLAGSGQEGPIIEPNDKFSTSTNINYGSSGALKIQGF